MMIKAMAVFALVAFAAASAHANPNERARLCKTLLTQRLMQDGWRLAQESETLLTFEKQSNFGQTFLMHALTGANSTWAVTRLTVAVIPFSDHYTQVQSGFSVNDQNAFGQATSVPAGNKKDAQYIRDLLSAVSAQMPARYKKQD